MLALHFATLQLCNLGAHLGDSWLWAFIMLGAWYIYLGSPAEANILGWIGSTLCAIGLAMGVKQLVRRSRPASATTEKFLYGIGPDVHSFPSGHATRMGAIATWGHLLWPGWGFLLWPLALWIGWSRVRLGVHYVGDIIAGLLLGGIVSTLWMQITN